MQTNAKERVLLVDDEPQVLVALEDLLGEQFVVFKTASAPEALDLMGRERDIAVVITDQRMPAMTGLEFLAKLGQFTDAARILLTGYADLSALIRAVNDGGVFAYIAKPWDPEDLRLRVHKAAEHFRLSQELAYERQLLYDLMHNIPDGVYFKDRDLRFLRANPAFTAMLKADNVENLVGKRLSEILGDSSYSQVTEAEEYGILSEGKPTLDAVREYHSNGDSAKHWFSETKAPIRNPKGDIVGLVGISRDVTERIRTLQALRESEEQFQNQTRILNSILDHMGEGVIAADRSGKFLLFTRQAEKILGIGPLDLTPAAWAESYGGYLPDQKTPLPIDQNPLACAMAGETRSESEVFIRNSVVAGSIVAINATPLKDDQNNLAGGIAVLRDVTQQRRLEEQLRQAQKMEAIGHLAGGVAHDFNNLLAVILSYGELLRRELPEGDPKREDLEEMLSAAQRATTLTKQLLAFGRRQVVQPRVLELNDAVTNLEKMLRRIVREDIDLITVLAPSLGAVRADAGQIEQIIVNLAVNARDAMPDGGKLTIETSNVVLDPECATSHPGVTPGQFVLLSVSDTGTGIDAETQKRIFEPFFTTKGIGQGTGLGLSTVYAIVQQSGGHIWVDSEVGRGTRFRVYFPKVEESVDAPERSRPGVHGPTAGGTILLIEDDEAVRHVAGRILRSGGYTVLETRRASDARNICAKQGASIDLLLTDVVMPETSGPKLAAELSHLCPGMRVLYMSGYAGGAGVHQHLLESGFAYLDKPFTPRSLTDKVREVLQAQA